MHKKRSLHNVSVEDSYVYCKGKKGNVFNFHTLLYADSLSPNNGLLIMQSNKLKLKMSLSKQIIALPVTIDITGDITKLFTDKGRVSNPFYFPIIF